MITGGVIVLALVNPRLTLYSAVATPLIGFVAWRFAHLVMPISRRVQAAKGDVTEAADEAVVGIEMVQAFGREDDVRERFGAKAASVRDIVVQPGGRRGHSTCPALFYLPTLSIAAVVFFGGRDVIDGRPHHRPVRPLQHHPPAADLAARGARLDPEPGPARARVGGPHVRLARARAAAARARASARAARRRALGRLRGRPLRLPGRGGGARPASTSRSIRARSWPCAARPAPGKSTLLNLLPRFYDPTAGRVLLGGVDLRDVAAGGACARDVAVDHPAADPVLDHPAREPDRRPAGRGLGRGGGDVRRPPASPTSCPTCRTATTR